MSFTFFFMKIDVNKERHKMTGVITGGCLTTCWLLRKGGSLNINVDIEDINIDKISAEVSFLSLPSPRTLFACYSEIFKLIWWLLMTLSCFCFGLQLHVGRVVPNFFTLHRRVSCSVFVIRDKLFFASLHLWLEWSESYQDMDRTGTDSGCITILPLFARHSLFLSVTLTHSNTHTHTHTHTHTVNQIEMMTEPPINPFVDRSLRWLQLIFSTVTGIFTIVTIFVTTGIFQNYCNYVRWTHSTFMCISNTFRCQHFIKEK